MPEHASQLYARNVQALLELFLDDEGNMSLDFDDEILAGAVVTRDGEIVHEGAKAKVEAG
jgi:NAD(P) transhydrogenase subunit alpha